MAETSIGMINNHGHAVVNGDVVGTKESPREPTPRAARSGQVDLLVVAALREELAAFQAAAPDVAWEQREADSPAAPLVGERHGLRIALARPTRMSGRSAAPIITELAVTLRPRCIAMPGVCAGNPRATVRGDVIIADSVYQHDEGKLRPTGFEGDHQQYPLDDRWLRAAQDFLPLDLPSYGRPLRFAVHVGPMASGNAVIEDPGIWQRLSGMGARKILGLEMEAATVATVAHQQRIPHWLVAKGVMDHAETGRDDGYKQLAARASAEVLWALTTSLLTREPAGT